MEDVSSGKYKFMKNCHELGRDVGVRNYNAQTSGVSRPGIRLRSSFLSITRPYNYLRTFESHFCTGNYDLNNYNLVD